MCHHGDANQTTRMKNHLVDRLRRRFFRSHDKIALVFAILIIGHDNHLARGDVANGRFDAIKGVALCSRHFLRLETLLW